MEQSERTERYIALHLEVGRLAPLLDDVYFREAEAHDQMLQRESELTLKYADLNDDLRRAKVFLEVEAERRAYRGVERERLDMFRAFDHAKTERDHLLRLLGY